MNLRKRAMLTAWLMSIQMVTAAENKGIFAAHDKGGAPVILEWQRTNLLSQDFAASMKGVWNIARQAYLPVEMQFLRSFPEVVQQEAYFKPFEQLFAQGIGAVDWDAVEMQMETILRSHFVFDPALFNDAMKEAFSNDICFFVSVKDQQSSEALGFITFMIRANYAYGDVKVMSFGVLPSHQNRGLGKLLMSSIFAVLSSVKRIFLCTRVTNENALQVYRNWGFTVDINPVMDHPFDLAHWMFLEYKTNNCNVLQNIADTFIK